MKLIATDYDGTLKYLKHVTQEDIQAIKRWQEAGHLFVIDTGRSMESILEEADKYGIAFDYFITNNGGMLFDKDQKELFASYLPRDYSLKMIDIAREESNVVSYVVNDGFYRHRIIIDDSLEEHRYPGLEPNMSEQEVLQINQYAQIVISLDSTQRAKELEAKLMKEYGHVMSFYANKYVVDVVPLNMSKATGLEKIRQIENMAIEDIYTIGDAANDITMLEYGINGCVMASATDDVKKHARFVYDNVGALINDLLK